MTFVSLFAGIGGFDLGFERAGFTPVGMCEIDAHARSVLDRHWPHVPKHDDVSTLTPDTFGPADVVTFGSPCQDLSVAGRRAGLDGERSGLFLEAVRYIREMLEATHGRYPRVAVWENVPGAFSSNGGEDFAAVLASLVGGEVRRPASGWANAGVAFGPLGSAEWRTLDSQYFGVPQRRRRIFLVYRPGGSSAGSVLLEPDGVPGDPPSRHSPGAGITGALTGGAGSSSAGNPDDNRAQAGFLIPAVMPTMRAGGTNDTPSKGQVSGDTRDEYIIPVPVETAPTVLASWGHNGYSSPRGDGTDPIVPVAFKVRGGKEGGGKGYLGSEDLALTISTVQEQYLAEPLAFVASDYGSGAYAPADKTETLTTSVDRTRAAPIAFALRGREDGAVPEVSGDRTNALRGAGGGSSRDYVTYPIDDGRPMEKRQNGLGIGGPTDPSYTLDTTGAQSVAVAFGLAQITSRENRTRAEPGLPASTLSANCDRPVATAYAVRRLTPVECERLQGFPDNWTALNHEGGEIADTHRYRMLGNAVTVTVAYWIGDRINAAALAASEETP